MNDYSLIVQIALGYILQWADSFKRVPTEAVKAICLVVAFGIYWGLHPDFHAANWFVDGITQALAALGAKSGSSAAGIAPKTDSIGPKP